MAAGKKTIVTCGFSVWRRACCNRQHVAGYDARRRAPGGLVQERDDEEYYMRPLVENVAALKITLARFTVIRCGVMNIVGNAQVVSESWLLSKSCFRYRRWY